MSFTMQKKIKILICSADKGVLKRSSSWINVMGEEVFTSNNIVEAKRILNDISFDIVIVSHDLKEMGAIEFIDFVKKSKPTQAVILMLGDDMDHVIFKRSIDLQVDKYLKLPLDASIFISTIETLSKEKNYHEEFESQKRLLQDYKVAIDKSYSVSKHDSDGKIFYVNESFCKTTQLSFKDAMKGSINPLMNPNEEMKSVWDELRKNKIYRNRQIFKFEDKQDHIIDITAVAILNQDESIKEFLVFSNDVTEVINASRKLKAQEIDKRIQKLEHAKELSKVKDSYLTVFSHELITPLNSIINFSQYIKKHLLKEDFKKRDSLVEQVSQINISGWYMLDMITNLIDSMKLKDGAIELIKSNFLLHEVVEEVMKKYEHELLSIKVNKSFKNECMIESDRKRMLQIIDNLVSNSLKYCKTQIALVIRLNKNTNEFSFEVIDDGNGFGDKSNVFELFGQLDEDSMTRTGQGIGIGLFVVKKLCDAMYYKINIEKSQYLGGARVIIRGKL